MPPRATKLLRFGKLDDLLSCSRSFSCTGPAFAGGEWQRRCEAVHAIGLWKDQIGLFAPTAFSDRWRKRRTNNPTKLRNYHRSRHAGVFDRCFSKRRWKEKLLRAKADNENCDDSDDMMCTHECLHCSGLMCDRGSGQDFCCFAFRLISALIKLFETRLYDPSKFGKFYVSAISVEQWSTKCLLQSLDRICK